MLLPGGIREKGKVEKLVSFVNSLPQAWSVPWYGPPVGKVYFQFYREGKPVGNFYVGPNFFGRDVFYGQGGHNFYSQPANREKIDELERLVGFGLPVYIDDRKTER